MQYSTRYIIIVIALLSAFESSFAQSADEIRSMPDIYLYGEGRSTTNKRADDYALESLISQISVTVHSDFESALIEETNSLSQSQVEQRSELIIETYATATLNNAQRLIISNEPSAHIMRYILRSDIDKIFSSRRKTIGEFVTLGMKGVKECKIDNALKYYYWALLLTKSLREPHAMEITDSEGNIQRAVTWLPEQINRVLDEITVYKGAKIDDNTYTLKFSYRDKSVATMDYTYYDGMNWSNIYSAKDGVGVVELREASLSDNIQVRCEYMFDNEIRQQREVESVSDAIDPIFFSAATINVMDGRYGNDNSIERDSEVEPRLTTEATTGTLSTLESVMLSKSNDVSSYTVPNVSLGAITEVTQSSQYTATMQRVAKAITSKDLASVADLFTDNGYEMFQNLVGYGNAKLLSSLDNLKYIGYGERITCRSIPLSFSFQRNNRIFTENLSFTFNDQDKIESLAFTLTQETTAELLSHTEWKEASRILIINFIEDYQTAYALKRWDYLNTVFDDDALIITGSVVHRTTMTDGGINFGDNRFVKLTRQSKAQYLRNLRGVFSSNEYINLKFANCTVSKFNESLGEVYGIQLKQDYYSANYADSGYLFLMVDLNNPSQPIIHVRTWQEKPDENFGVIDNTIF